MHRRANLLLLIAILFAAASVFAGGKVPDWILREKFVRACADGDTAAVKQLLDQGVAPDSRDMFGQPAIFRAVGWRADYEKQVEIIKLLLAAGVDINTRNEFGSTPIFITAGNHYRPSPPHLFLLASGADRDVKDYWGLLFEQRPEYSLFVKPKPEEEAWRLLLEGDLGQLGQEQAKMPRHSNTATFGMAMAYYDVDLRVPDGFINEFDVDANGETLLFYKVSRLRFGANEFDEPNPRLANVQNNAGETALIKAAMFDNDLYILKLVGMGADPNIRDKAGNTALWYSAKYDYFMSTLNLLGASGQGSAAADGTTPLILAAKLGNLRSVMAFATAKQMAKSPPPKPQVPKYYKETTQTILARMRAIDPDRSDAIGRTALMYAAEAGHADIVKALLIMGSSRSKRDLKGKSAADLARAAGKNNILKLLSTRTR
ncbi:MAG: hypothetical protein K1X36_12425 [Pyrinomonadaceae bacterium]|nr:hypothetical protein [Pyrinomonadaceae bacterium]